MADEVKTPRPCDVPTFVALEQQLAVNILAHNLSTATSSEVAARMSCRTLDARWHLKRLRERGFVQSTFDPALGLCWSMTPAGKAAIVRVMRLGVWADV